MFSCEFAHGFIDFEELSIDLSVIKFGRRLAKFVGKHNIRFMLFASPFVSVSKR